jgi:hypothetical protein
MSIKIISHRKLVEVVTYHRYFEHENIPGAGFSFDCDEHGNLDEEKYAKEKPVAYGSYKQCLTGIVNITDGPSKVKDRGVQKYEHHYWESAIGECVCGEEVYLSGFTNTCDKCERDYNGSGQELAPRSQWGEETGESLADILGPSTDDDW